MLANNCAICASYVILYGHEMLYIQKKKRSYDTTFCERDCEREYTQNHAGCLLADIPKDHAFNLRLHVYMLSNAYCVLR